MRNPFGNLSEEAMEDCEIDSVDDETAYLLWVGGLFVYKIRGKGSGYNAFYHFSYLCIYDTINAAHV